MGNKYESSKPKTARETTALKAVVEPIFMSPRSANKTDVTIAAFVGICLASSIRDRKEENGKAEANYSA